MEPKRYNYSSTIRTLKASSKLLLLVYLFLSGVVILNYPSTGQTKEGIWYLLIGIPIAIFFVIFYLGDYPDVKVDDDGLYVEFLWMYLAIPWKDIVEIQYFRFIFLEWWLITTGNHLTFFHRLYSIYSLKSFLPGFLIHHREGKDQLNLLRLIRKQVISTSEPSKSL